MIPLWILTKKSSASLKKIQISRFINTKLKSDSESSDLDLDSEKIGSKFDDELMAKLEKYG